jgi:hypothetical protein
VESHTAGLIAGPQNAAGHRLWLGTRFHSTADGRRPHRAPGGNRANSRDEVLRRATLHQKTDCARCRGILHHGGVSRSGEHQNPDTRLLGKEYPGGLRPVCPWHLDIHQDDVRLDVCNRIGYVGAVFAFSDNDQVTGAAQNRGQPDSDEAVIVDYEDLDHVTPLLRSRFFSRMFAYLNNRTQFGSGGHGTPVSRP